MPEKLAKYPNFIIFARKVNKIPEFYMIFAQKVPELYIIIARKICFPEFFGGGGTCPLPSPPPVYCAHNTKTSETAIPPPASLPSLKPLYLRQPACHLLNRYTSASQPLKPQYLR